MQQLLTALINLINTFLHKFDKLDERVTEGEKRMARLDDITAALEADVQQVKDALAAQKQAVADLKAIVEELRGQIPTGELLDRLNKVDADLDAAIAPETPPVEPPAEPPAEPVATRSRRN